MTSVTVGDPDLHIEHPDLIGRRWRTGVLLLILADAAFVLALVFSYFYLRGLNTEQAWLAPKQQIASIWIGWLVALGAAASALAYRWAYQRIQADEVGRFVIGALLALVILAADAVVQVVQLAGFPFGVADSAYSSSVYTLAGANLFHLLLTLFLSVGMWNRGRRGLYGAESHWQVRLVGIWWTWVAVAAVLGAFTTSFVTSPNIGR